MGQHPAAASILTNLARQTARESWDRHFLTPDRTPGPSDTPAALSFFAAIFLVIGLLMVAWSPPDCSPIAATAGYMSCPMGWGVPAGAILASCAALGLAALTAIRLGSVGGKARSGGGTAER